MTANLAARRGLGDAKSYSSQVLVQHAQASGARGVRAGRRIRALTCLWGRFPRRMYTNFYAQRQSARRAATVNAANARRRRIGDERASHPEGTAYYS